MTKAQYNQAILAAAGEYLGLQEWPGAKNNPAVLELFSAVGHDWVQEDSTPWCAAFVGAVLASLGLPHTGALNARSYATYGADVPLSRMTPGDIVVLWRGSPTSWQGHVGFFVRFDGDRVILRGGNQGNAVSDAGYPRDRIVAVRRADGVAAKGARPVLRHGSRGAFVLDLQQQIRDRGYHMGALDGAFGKQTEAAVIKFQRDNNLLADGIVGDRTWEALLSAPEVSDRDVTMDDLKDRSQTVAEAERGKAQAGVGGAIAGASVLAAQAEDAVAVIQQAEGVLDAVLGLAPTALILLAVAGAAWLAWRQFNRIEARRLQDARSGANMRI